MVHHEQQRPADAVSLDVAEPLAESAPLALQWATAHCGRCGSYHGAWQTLRLLGVLNSIRSDDDFFIPQLDRAIRSGAGRILISGAADYALLARVAAVAKRHGVAPEVTVMDRCQTPLALNRWYARRAGMEVETVHGDILDYRNPGRFDLVCTHSFLCFFKQREREKLAGVWWDCLVPGGAVLTAQRARPDDPSPRHEFTAAQAAALGERAHRLATERFERLGIEPERARRLAVAYAEGRSTFLVRDSEQLRGLFLRQGFELAHFAPPGGAQPVADIPSTPTRSGHLRWRILAVKPAARSS
jgi:SAM-dependent methyltransferase